MIFLIQRPQKAFCPVLRSSIFAASAFCFWGVPILHAAPSEWSLKCVDSKALPHRRSECSMVQGLVSQSDKSIWVRLGVTYSDVSEEPNLTIVTPLIHFLRDGISILADDKQLGQVPVDYCDATSCTSNVRVDGQLLSDLEVAKKVDFEFQTSESSGVRISAPFNSFLTSLNELRTDIGIPTNTLLESSTANSPDGSTEIATVQIRHDPYVYAPSGNNLSFGELAPACNGEAPTLTIQTLDKGTSYNEERFDNWIKATSPCSKNDVYWVIPKINTPSFSFFGTTIQGVYDTLMHKAPNGKVVLIGSDGLPTRPITALDLSTSHDWAAALGPN